MYVAVQRLVVSMESLLEVAKRPLLDVAAEVSGALVYLDQGAGEFAHLSLGPAFLFGKLTLIRHHSADLF